MIRNFNNNDTVLYLSVCLSFCNICQSHERLPVAVIDAKTLSQSVCAC